MLQATRSWREAAQEMASMAKVPGLGGLLFKASAPRRPRAWYRDCLGMPVDGYGAAFHPGAIPAGAESGSPPFASVTESFRRSGRDTMINLVVDGLDGCLAQVREAGATLAGEVVEEE